MITVEGRPIHCLTQAEQVEHCCLDLCYNCDEKFGRGNNRLFKRLCLLNGVIDDDTAMGTEANEEIIEEETPHYSLNTIVGVSFSNTMQVRVVMGTAVSWHSWT